MKSDSKLIGKFIEKYIRLLETYSNQNCFNESTVETAFKELLINIGNIHNLTLVKESIRTKSGKNVIPDGILRDEFRLTRGIWEAKDSKDDLNNEISNKITKGYKKYNI